jgi:hypothetical protein
MGSYDPAAGVRSIVSQPESSKPGSAHSGLPVEGFTGESPTENFHGPFSGKADWPTTMRSLPASRAGEACEDEAGCAQHKASDAKSAATTKADRDRLAIE